MIDSRLRQAFPHKSAATFGGCSVILVGYFGQLPPVMDLPVYSPLSRSAISDFGRTVYLTFTKAETLTQIMRQSVRNNFVNFFSV